MKIDTIHHLQQLIIASNRNGFNLSNNDLQGITSKNILDVIADLVEIYLDIENKDSSILYQDKAIEALYLATGARENDRAYFADLTLYCNEFCKSIKTIYKKEVYFDVEFYCGKTHNYAKFTYSDSYKIKSIANDNKFENYVAERTAKNDMPNKVVNYGVNHFTIIKPNTFAAWNNYLALLDAKEFMSELFDKLK